MGPIVEPIELDCMLIQFSGPSDIINFDCIFNNRTTGWPKKTGTLLYVLINFVKYGPIFKLVSLSESGENLLIVLSLKITSHLSVSLHYLVAR